MNLKPTFFSFIFFFFISTISAQVDFKLNYAQKFYTCKHRMLYGGALNFQSPVTDLKVLHTGIQPQFGGFVVNNFAILGILHASFGFHPDNGRYIINTGGGPEFRYYIGESSSKFYVYVNAVPHYVNYQGHHFGIMGGGGPGVAFFTGSRFSINIGLYAGIYRLASHYENSPVFAFNLVLNGMFLGGKKKNIDGVIDDEYLLNDD